jgi:hypothetical protein
MGGPWQDALKVISIIIALYQHLPFISFYQVLNNYFTHFLFVGQGLETVHQGCEG